jgi:hypothetical protein
VLGFAMEPPSQALPSAHCRCSSSGRRSSPWPWRSSTGRECASSSSAWS